MSNMNPKMEDIDTKISNLMDSFAQICDTLISSIKHLESIKHDNSAIHNKLKELSGVVSDIKSIKATI
jgi:cell shape-determining protein MreC